MEGDPGDACNTKDAAAAERPLCKEELWDELEARLHRRGLCLDDLDVESDWLSVLRELSFSALESSVVLKLIKRRRVEIGKSSPADSIWTINVGGRRFMTRKGTLLAFGGNTFFGRMIEGSFELSRDSDGALFLDRDPEYFGAILEILRTERYPGCPPTLSEARLSAELDFYGISVAPVASPASDQKLLSLRAAAPSKWASAEMIVFEVARWCAERGTSSCLVSSNFDKASIMATLTVRVDASSVKPFKPSEKVDLTVCDDAWVEQLTRLAEPNYGDHADFTAFFQEYHRLSVTLRSYRRYLVVDGDEDRVKWVDNIQDYFVAASLLIPATCFIISWNPTILT